MWNGAVGVRMGIPVTGGRGRGEGLKWGGGDVVLEGTGGEGRGGW